MGLPEILDVARNYAAMVRVQGPDPKGLKMRKHAFHHYHSGKTTLSSSGMVLPGTLRFTPRAGRTQGDDGKWLPGSALVVTVASVIEPFLSQHYRENISQAKPELIPGVQIDIMVEDLEGRMGEQYEAQGSDKGAPHWLSAQLLKLVDVPVSSIALQSLVESSSGSLEHGWEVGWSLATSSDGPQPFMDAIQAQNQRQTVGGDTSSPSLMCMSTTRIALLGIPSRFVKDLPNLNMLPSNKRGDLLLAIGSPFGILSPLHFFNSISVGSISNCYPRNSSTKSLLMADVRCLPGMEGAPVFGEQAQLIGLLTKPLRRKGSDAEIQLVIPWEAIATACSDLLQEEPKNAWKETYCNSGTLNAVGKTCTSNSFDLDGYANQFHEHHDSGSRPSPVEKAMASICLVTVDNGVWASGVLLNSQGLILTNAHLLEPWRFGKSPAKGLKYETKSELLSIRSNEYVPPGHEGVGDLQRNQSLLPRRPKTADSLVVDEHIIYKFSSTNINHRRIRVRLDHVDPWIWCNARVVFVAKGPLDIALLQLQYVPDQLCPVVMDFTCPRPGSKAYVIGHGLFGPRCDSSPSVCVGVVAKVVEAKRPVSYQSGLQENVGGHFPAMLETTAAVHPGGSGGAIINSVGHMIGLVTSNARHGGGSVIPHLNFSIPCAALEPIFKFSKDMGDLSLLEDLDRPDKDLSAVWALMPPLSPKPGPPLPSLPKSAPGDTDKDGKGSRFAKFIAERHEGLNKATDLGKVERLSSKSIPSKL